MQDVKRNEFSWGLLIQKLGLWLVVLNAILFIFLWKFEPTVLHGMAVLFGNGMAFITTLCFALLGFGAIFQGSLKRLGLLTAIVSLLICGLKVVFYLGLINFDVEFLFVRYMSAEVRMGAQTAIALTFVAIDQVLRFPQKDAAISDLFRVLALTIGLIGLADNILIYINFGYYYDHAGPTSLPTSFLLIVITLCQWPNLGSVRSPREFVSVLEIRKYALSMVILLIGFIATEENQRIESKNAARELERDITVMSQTIVRNSQLIYGAATRALNEPSPDRRAQLITEDERFFDKLDIYFVAYETQAERDAALQKLIEQSADQLEFGGSVELIPTQSQAFNMRVSGGFSADKQPFLLYSATLADRPDSEGVFVLTHPMSLLLDQNEPADRLQVRISVDDTELLGANDADAWQSAMTKEIQFEFADQLLELSIFPTQKFASEFLLFSTNWLFPLIAIIALVVGIGAQQASIARKDVVELAKLNNEKNLMLAKLESQNNELSQFAYICSHDLKEPFRMVSTFSKRLQSHLDAADLNDETTGEYLAILSEAGDRAGNLIEDLLAYTICDDDNIPRKLLNPVPIIEDCFESAKMIKPERTYDLTYGKITLIDVNPLQLKQIFQNLIDNAVKYSRPEGPISVKVFTRPSKQGDVFVVKDNGIGIPARHRDKVFGVFKRLQGRSEISGTGIGLAICAKIVAAYRGKIWVDPDCPDGTEICFTLPAALKST